VLSWKEVGGPVQQFVRCGKPGDSAARRTKALTPLPLPAPGRERPAAEGRKAPCPIARDGGGAPGAGGDRRKGAPNGWLEHARASAILNRKGAAPGSAACTKGRQ